MIHIHRWSKQQCGTSSGMSSSHANERWLKTPELREKVVELKTRMRSAESSIKYLKSRIESSIHARGVEVDDSLESGLGDVMREFAAHVESKYTTNSFHRLFWSQQAKMAATNPKQRRWHPMFIRWCLHLKMTSTAAYNSLRGILTLPCGRTLQVYV